MCTLKPTILNLINSMRTKFLAKKITPPMSEEEIGLISVICSMLTLMVMMFTVVLISLFTVIE